MIGRGPAERGGQGLVRGVGLWWWSWWSPVGWQASCRTI